MLRIVVILSVLFISFVQLSSQTDIQDSSVTTSQTTDYMSKSPSGALWRSVIPGWGQYYNEEYSYNCYTNNYFEVVRFPKVFLYIIIKKQTL